MSNFEKFKFVINSIYNSKVFLNKDGTLEELEKIFFKCQHLEAICMDDKINYTRKGKKTLQLYYQFIDCPRDSDIAHMTLMILELLYHMAI
uniref:Uncharacterized protein n=1 Tax=Rhizophagus irregularis (strain DAOM 181602 / DAOM 197198 / MUCL 43194) TaxID=747089 RepID=U9TQT6_RHIID